MHMRDSPDDFPLPAGGHKLSRSLLCLKRFFWRRIFSSSENIVQPPVEPLYVVLARDSSHMIWGKCEKVNFFLDIADNLYIILVVKSGRKWGMAVKWLHF